MGYVEKAFEIAKAAHEGQYDIAGEPYIEHPKHVADSVHSYEAKAVAYLHDVIEDTDVKEEDLRRAGIPEIVIEAVVAMTHRPHENYFDYIERVKKNPIARTVKLADLGHNMDLSRIENPTAEDHERRKKYEKAVKILNS